MRRIALFLGALAVTFAAAWVVTGCVVTVNVAVVALATTVTVEGTVAAWVLLSRETLKPPVGAALLRTTVPMAEAPPIKVAGTRLKEESFGGRIVRVAEPELLPSDAFITTEAAAATGNVVTVNVVVAFPA